MQFRGNTSGGFYPISNRKNHIKIVVFYHTTNLSFSFIFNCRKFCDSCHVF